MLGVAEPQIEGVFLKTFVGGLPFHCHEEELRLFMEYFGSVEQIYISKDLQGQHKGFAFVNFSELYQGYQLFGEHSFKSKLIEVKLNLMNTLFLQGVPHFITEGDIKNVIEMLGYAVESVMLGNGRNGIPLATCSVRLEDEYQVSSASLIEKIEVKGVRIYMEAKTHRFMMSKAIKEITSYKRKNNKRVQQHHNSEKKHKTYFQDNTPALSNIPMLEPEFYGSGQPMNVNRPSVNDLSIGELKETTDIKSFSGKNKRKLSDSLQSISKEFTPKSNKMESIEIGASESGQLVNYIVFEEPDFFPMTTVRHNSESITGTSLDSIGVGRKLSCFSSSFYSGDVACNRKFCVLASEVKIAFYTFPGRE